MSTNKTPAQYLGTLLVTALPMTRLEYNQHRGWTLPSDENGDDIGFIITQDDNGHVNWLPADVFEASYYEVDTVSDTLHYGFALMELQDGAHMARTGWNGKDMYVFFVPATDSTRAYFMMRLADGSFVPWVPSISDQLAEDWVIVPKQPKTEDDEIGIPDWQLRVIAERDEFNGRLAKLDTFLVSHLEPDGIKDRHLLIKQAEGMRLTLEALNLQIANF